MEPLRTFSKSPSFINYAGKYISEFWDSLLNLEASTMFTANIE